LLDSRNFCSATGQRFRSV